MTGAFITGFVTGFSLILAIGAQNAFVLRQGLLRTNVFWLCLLCASSDALLITAGVVGFGAMVTIYPMFPLIMAWGGAAFLFVYGGMRFFAAYKGDYTIITAGKSGGLWAVLLTGLALTWVNPHVYLDTLGLVGAVSTGFEQIPEKWAFGFGATSASFVFFFSLGYGARFLAPIMGSARAWRILDLLIGITMWVLAVGLVLA